LIVFPAARNLHPKFESDKFDSPFGVGSVLEVRGPLDVHFQWWGNDRASKPSGTFKPGWISAKDNKGYYSHKKEQRGNKPWTNADTRTNVRLCDIILRGTRRELLTEVGLLNKRARELIQRATSEKIVWDD
jgi:hypothetical protein